MTITWKPQPAQYGGGDSTFGAEFAKAEPAIAKQLCNAAGAFEDKKSVTVGAYSYRVKIVPKKDGSGSYTFIERKQTFVGLGDEKPEVVAHKATLQQYQDSETAKHEWNAAAGGQNPYDQRQKDITLAHQDNLRIHAEAMEASKAQTAALLVLANEIQGLKHIAEIMVGESDVIKKSFKPASELKTGGGNNTA